MALYTLPDEVKENGKCPQCEGTISFQLRDRGTKLFLVCSNDDDHNRRADTAEVNDFAKK
ncbi:hypothetical protein KKF61_03845 [Patescibacteria group bacterium]|nr:hypothetical protein [Patescibacteria group bacterium]MBU0964163.1 hypothetical protein [Patescibacteria group bacterium]